MGRRKKRYRSTLTTTRKRERKLEYERYVDSAGIMELPGKIRQDADCTNSLSDSDTDKVTNECDIKSEGDSQLAFDSNFTTQDDGDAMSEILKCPVDAGSEFEEDLEEEDRGKPNHDVDRLHGLYRYSSSQRLAEGSYNETRVCRTHPFDTILRDTCTETLSENDLALKVMAFFKTMHPLERYGSLAPQPSTFICPTCSVDQCSKQDFKSHIVLCRRDTAKRINDIGFNTIIDLDIEFTSCDWFIGKVLRRCGKTCTDRESYLRHVLQHLWYCTKCRYGTCATKPNAPELETRDGWSDHLATVHHIIYMQSSSQIFLCSFCDEYITFATIVGPGARTAHYANHMHAALESVRKFGYNGVCSSYAAFNGSDCPTSILLRLLSAQCRLIATR